MNNGYIMYEINFTSIYANNNSDPYQISPLTLQIDNVPLEIFCKNEIICNKYSESLLGDGSKFYLNLTFNKKN